MKHVESAVKIYFTREYSAFKHYNTRNFILSVWKINGAKKIKMSELIDKFDRFPEMIVFNSSVKEYLANMEELYNFKLKKRIIIF